MSWSCPGESEPVRSWLTELPAHAVDLDKGEGTESREMPCHLCLPLHFPFHPSRLLCLAGKQKMGEKKGGGIKVPILYPHPRKFSVYQTVVRGSGSQQPAASSSIRRNLFSRQYRNQRITLKGRSEGGRSPWSPFDPGMRPGCVFLPASPTF